MNRGRLALVAAVCLAAACGGGDSAQGGGDLALDFAYPSTGSSVGRFLSITVTPRSTAQLGGHSAHHTIVSGALPPGLVLDPGTGRVSGAPTQNGSYSATVQVTVDGYSGALTTSLGLTVVDPVVQLAPHYPTLALAGLAGDWKMSSFVQGVRVAGTSLTLGDASGHVGASTGVTFGGPASPVTWETVGTVALPPGLTLDPSGAVTGTPTGPGVWRVQLRGSVTSQGAVHQFTAPVMFAVAAVVQEHAGAQAAPVVAPVGKEAGDSASGSLLNGFGSSNCGMSWNAGASQVTLTPGTLSPTANPGAYIGAWIMNVHVATDSASLYCIEVVDSTLVVR